MAIAFIVLFVAGIVLVSIEDYSLLLSPLVSTVASPSASATVMVAHIPSSLSIILLPLYTIFKIKKTNWKALLMSIGGLVVSLAGVLLAFFTLNPIDIPLLILILTVLPIMLVITAVFFVFGMLLPEIWSFAIPGL